MWIRQNDYFFIKIVGFFVGTNMLHFVPLFLNHKQHELKKLVQKNSTYSSNFMFISKSEKYLPVMHLNTTVTNTINTK